MAKNATIPVDKTENYDEDFADEHENSTKLIILKSKTHLNFKQYFLN